MQKSSLAEQVKKLPSAPGVYFFRDGQKKILYIGKATSLRSRVSSYLRGADGRGERILSMVDQAVQIDFIETDSVLEALILESNLIKKHQPKYNVQEKDDKSFSYFVITKEQFPRILIVRKTDLDKMVRKSVCHPALDAGSSKSHQVGDVLDSRLRGNDNKKKFRYDDVLIAKYFGPYISKYQMETALKIMRKIFPFHNSKQQTEKGCLDFQIGLCPGPYANAISKAEYAKNIRGIKMILEGKKKSLLRTLEKEMAVAAKGEEYEKAAKLRNKIYALQHIRDIALMTREFEEESLVISNQSLVTDYELPITKLRVEAYDISNISGQHAVGSMVVFENGRPNKSQYRKFKIKTVAGANDVGMMREVLLRRFKNDWTMPALVLLDGGQGHANMMGELVRELGLYVFVVAVAKGKTRKNLNFQFPTCLAGRRVSNEIPMAQFPNEIRKFLENKLLVKQIMDEAHRFAVTFHREVRQKNILN